MNSKEQEIIQNSEIKVPGWVLYTLLQHLEVSWDSKSLTIPQTEVTINSYRLGSRLLRETIDSKTNETTKPGLEPILEEPVQETVKPKKKKSKPKK